MDPAQDPSKPIKTFHDRVRSTHRGRSPPKVKGNHEMDPAQDLSKPIKTFHDRVRNTRRRRSPPEVKGNHEMDPALDLSKPIKTFHGLSAYTKSLGVSGATGQRLADLPMMSKWINESSDTPPIGLVIHGPDTSRSRRDGSLERGVRIADNHHHSDGTAAKRFWAEIEMFRRLIREPKLGLACGELRYYGSP